MNRIIPTSRPCFTAANVIKENLGDYVLEFPLASEVSRSDGRLLKVHLMSVRIVDTRLSQYGQRGLYDFVFGICNMEPGGTLPSDLDFSRQAVQRFIRKTHRAEVLHSVCLAAKVLVEAAHPTYISMMTFDADLPEKALHKYHRLASAFHAEGYACQRSVVEEDGRLQWLFERAD